MLDFSALRPLTAEIPPIVILSSLDSGGAGVAALRLHQGLLAAGADVKMVVIRKNSKEATVGELSANGAPLWNQAAAGWARAIQDYPARPAGLEMFSTVEAPFNVAELDVVKNAGLVNLHWCAGMLPWPEASANLRGKPLVWTLHDMNPFTGGCHYAAGCERWKQGGCGECPQLGPSASGGDLAAAGFAAKRNGYAGLDWHIVTPSKWLSDCAGQSILLRDFPRTVIPNGFPLEELRSSDRAAARQALGLPQGPKIILFGADVCGNRRKGLHLLLEALPQLAAKWQGEPPILATFGNASGMPTMPPGFKCLHLGEIKDNSALACAYSSADVFVLPSTEDNLPNTIVEAQACGTPGVGFSIGGIPDIIANPSLGRLARPFDTNDLANKIREVLLASPEETAACRKDCREHAENAYSQYAQTAAYLRLYRERLGLPEVAPAASTFKAMPNDASMASATNATSIDSATEMAFFRGQRLMDSANYAEALKVFSALKAHRTRHANLDLFRGYCFLQMRQFLAGRQALLEELRFFPDNQNAKGLLAQIQMQISARQEQEMAAVQVNDEFRELFAHINDYTMVCVPRLWSLYRLTRQVCETDVPGNFVECGVAGGGTSALIAAVLHRYSRRPRQLFSFDTFSGMPTPTAEDFLAHNKQGADDSHWGTGTCAAPEDSLRKIAMELGVLGHIVITKGLFADTLPTRKADIGEIAFLHMDGDWYQSTKDIIDNLYEQLRPGGAVQVDDFGGWAGCRKALEEYFSRIGFAPEITVIDGTGVSFPITEALTRAVHAATMRAAPTAMSPVAATVAPTVANATAINDATHNENDDRFAPIALFAYNRRDLVEKTVNALKANPEAAQSDLYIFADGAKPGQEENVNAVRDYLRAVSGFRSVHLTCRESNMGLAPNVIDGVTAVVNAHGRVIVMEDDLVTSPHYLRYMNEALTMYANTPEVVCVSGYAYPVKEKMPETYFIRGTCCWGWATWKRGWEVFNPDSEALYNAIVARNATRDFDFDGCYSYTWALKNNKKSWAVRWMASAFVGNKLCLFPGRSLVNNIGFGGDATNCLAVSGGDPYQTEVTEEPIQLQKTAPIENPEHRRAVGKFLRWSVVVLTYAYKFERMPSTQVLQAMIECVHDGNNYDIAAFVLDKLIQRGDGNLENVYALRGFSRWQLGDRAGGEEDIREELRRYPNNKLANDFLRLLANGAVPAASTPTMTATPSTAATNALAPIVLFAYNRRDMVEKTVNALKANPEAAQSDLYIFADGAQPWQEEKVNDVREYLRTVSGFRSVHLTCRESNMGLAPNIIDGVTKVVNAHGRVIVMEDDLVTSPHFLRYMNEALTMYADTQEVICISGYAYPVKEKMPETYFIRGTNCMGWATWKRGWEVFNPDSEALYHAIVARNAARDFDFDGSYSFTWALKNNKKSWAVRWMASAFLENKLCLFPGRSLVNHIGFGGDATNCLAVSGGDPYQTEVTLEPIQLQKIAPVENPEHRRAVGKFYRWAAIVLEYAYKYERMPGDYVLQAMTGVLGRNGYDIAAFVLDKLIERGDGDLENVYALRGFSRWQLGDRARGEADVREELRRHPNNPVALDLLRQIEGKA